MLQFAVQHADDAAGSEAGPIIPDVAIIAALTMEIGGSTYETIPEDLIATCGIRSSASAGRASDGRSYPFLYRQEKSTWRFRQVPDLSTEFGRRDWTRTNDPHHVKVGERDVLEHPGIEFS